jgi:hypothetical protein
VYKALRREGSQKELVMKYRTLQFAAAALLVAAGVVALSSSFAGEAPKKPRGMMATLKVGDSVSLVRDRVGCFIYFPKAGMAANKVVEVGDDYVVIHVKDEGVGTDSDIAVPVYSLRWIERPR